MKKDGDSTAHIPQEFLSKLEKLLRESNTGAQALMLLGLEPPKSSVPMPQLEPARIEELANHGLDAEFSKKITNASFNERAKYWTNKAPDKTYAERMEEWRGSTNAFLNQCKNDITKKAELTFLQKLLKRDGQKTLDEVEVTAAAVYNTFMQGEGLGNVEYYARRIIEKTDCNIYEIEQNKHLIRKLGIIYGANSAKIIELLTDGIANVKKNLDRFVYSAQENLSKGNYGDINIWKQLDMHSTDRDKKEEKNKKQLGTIIRHLDPQQSAPPSHPPKQEREQKSSPIACDKGESAKSKDHDDNQDAYFEDDKNAAYGVFDGVGESHDPLKAIDLAKKLIPEALAEIPLNADVNYAKKKIGVAFQKASNEIFAVTSLSKEEIERIVKEERDRLGKLHNAEYEPREILELKSVSGKTTATVVKILEQIDAHGKKKKTAVIACIGDSRAYIQRGGRIAQVTEDDDVLKLLKNYFEDLQQAEQVRTKLKNYIRLDELSTTDGVELKDAIRAEWNKLNLHEIFGDISFYDRTGKIIISERRILSHSNIMTESIGSRTINVSFYEEEVKNGDKILITSDGVHDCLTEVEIEKILNDHLDAKNASKIITEETRRVLEDKNRQRKKHDDATAVVIKID